MIFFLSIILLSFLNIIKKNIINIQIFESSFSSGSILKFAFSWLTRLVYDRWGNNWFTYSPAYLLFVEIFQFTWSTTHPFSTCKFCLQLLIHFKIGLFEITFVLFFLLFSTISRKNIRSHFVFDSNIQTEIITSSLMVKNLRQGKSFSG